MALKACGVARGRAGASRAPVSPRGQRGPTCPPSPAPGPGPLCAHLVPHRLLRIHGEAAEHRQDFVGAVIHGVEVVGGSEAQNTGNPRRCKRVLSGPAEGGDEDPVSGLGGAGERAPECRVSPGAQKCQASLPRAEAIRAQGSQGLKKGLVTNKWG